MELTVSEKEGYSMKVKGRWLLTLLSAIFVIFAGITAVAAGLICLAEALGLTELLAGFVLYAFLCQMMPIAGLLTILFGVLMVADGIYLKRKYPDHIDLAQRGDAVTEWLLNFDVAYLLATVLSQVILLIRFWDVQTESFKDAAGLVFYLLDAGWLWLGLAVVLIAVNAVCKKLAYDD